MSTLGSMVQITRKVTFCAAHRYHQPAWSDERNREVFGACNNPHGHGHNYRLEVTVAGPVDPETGMVMNLTDIDAVLKREVVDVYDHRFVNHEVPGFDRRVPTTENIALDIWDRLEAPLSIGSARLWRVRLYESDSLFADVVAEDQEP